MEQNTMTLNDYRAIVKRRKWSFILPAVILVGGGAVLIDNHMRDYYGDKVLDTRKHPLTKKIHPVDMNAVGGLRLAHMRLKQA